MEPKKHFGNKKRSLTLTFNFSVLLPTRGASSFLLGVSRYTGIDDKHDIQSNNNRYRVNLVCDDIPVLAITAIFKQNRTLMITCKYSRASTWLTSRWQYCVLTLTPITQEEEQRCSSFSEKSCVHHSKLPLFY